MNPLVWSASATLFLFGLAALILRRELLAMFLGLELMVLAAVLALGETAARLGDSEGFVAVLLILAIAAAEAVVGLTLILRVHWSGRPPETEALRELKG